MSPFGLSPANRGGDQRFVLKLAAALLCAILLVSFVSPSATDSDPSPTTYNTGSAGIKASYLLLQRLGYAAERWDQAPGALRSTNALQTTLVLAEPQVPENQVEAVRSDIADFLARGGHVLVTGVAGAYLLPGGETRAAGGLFHALCYTTPEGQGVLARAGSIAMADAGSWTDRSPASRVEQWCGQDAVVVSYTVGAGQAIWWSSPTPLTNRGLKNDASLKLVLASVGQPGRRVLFDEYFHSAEASVWDEARGLPVKALALQAGLVAVLLVLSFGRRNGPLRDPVHAIRSSPLEFAQSMGHLYRKAGATQVAIEGARRRLLRFLQQQCGVPQHVLESSPQGVADAVHARLGGDWSALADHLAQAASAEHASLSPGSALSLVKALDQDVARLTGGIRGSMRSPGVENQSEQQERMQTR